MTQDYAVINIDDGNDVVHDIKRVLVPVPGPPGPPGEIDPDIEAALLGANDPSASNVFSTVVDLFMRGTVNPTMITGAGSGTIFIENNEIFRLFESGGTAAPLTTYTLNTASISVGDVFMMDVDRTVTAVKQVRFLINSSQYVYLNPGDGVILQWMGGTSFRKLSYAPDATVINGAYRVKGAFEPIYPNGLVTGTYVFSYNEDGGNMHSVTFDATDCDLSWSNLPPTLNRGSMGLNTTTGATLPSTLGGSSSPDWQVELLSLLVINSNQTFELWVDDGSTVRIQEYKYSGQA